jgi:hypothetical protein
VINQTNCSFLLVINPYGVVDYLKNKGLKKNSSFLFIQNKIYIPLSWTQVQLNISSTAKVGTSRTATPIAFDGKLTNNAQIELENILIAHQPCPSSKHCFII